MSDQILQFALTVSSVAAFAIPGPAGILVSAGLSGINEMLSGGSSTPPITPAEIQSTVTGSINTNELGITNANVQTAMQEFMSYVGPNLQINVDVPTNLNYAITHDPNDPGVVFYELLNSWVTGEPAGASILLQEVNTLEPTSQASNPGEPPPTYNCPVVVNFNSFLGAASFYLVVYKTWAIFNQMGGSPFNSNQCSFVQTQLQGWINFTQAISSSIESQITNRLNQVTPVTPYTVGLGTEIFNSPPSDSFVYFADNGGPVPGSTPPSMPNEALNWAPSNNNVIASMWGDNNAAGLTPLRQAYVAQLTSSLLQDFGDFDQQSTQSILGNWQAIAQELAYMLKNGGLPQAS